MHSKRTAIAAMVAALILSLFCLIYPVYVIRPFRYQGPRELAVALAVMRYRPLAMLLSALLAVAVAAVCRRVLTVLAAVAVCLVAGLSRINVYELMFHPLDRPAFQPAAQSKLDGDEKVLAVSIGGKARAYPIRGMSYHHVVNDVVGGVPIVATY